MKAASNRRWLPPLFRSRREACLVSAAAWLLACFSLPAQITPLPQAHAHNDYEHTRPLFDALDNGFCSVEADIHLVNGRLLVAHDREATKPDTTLQSLYLDPLRERVRRNGGRVYSNGPPFTLLIDVKSDAQETYAALRGVLRDYADVLTEFRKDATRTGAITAIISGNRDRLAMAAETTRHAALDGRLEDLGGNAPRHLVPLISDNWTQQFQWRGEGAMPANEKEKLRRIVKTAHAEGRRVRFWAAPDEAGTWRELRDAGVDLINTDKLVSLRKFLISLSPDAK